MTISRSFPLNLVFFFNVFEITLLQEAKIATSERMVARSLYIII